MLNINLKKNFVKGDMIMTLKSIEEYYNFYTGGGGCSIDIIEHLPTIKKYASECDTICEMGVRWMVSTWAFLAGKPKKMTSYDIEHPNKYNNDLYFAETFTREVGIDFKFILADTLKIEIEEVDMLFIDTLHTYEQLSQELALHGNKAKKYLMFHDSISFPEMTPAIFDFIKKNPQWSVKEHFENCNGLMILERK